MRRVIAFAVASVIGVIGVVCLNGEEPKPAEEKVPVIEPTKKFSGHKGGAGCLAFTGDGKYLISTGVDQVIRVWDVESGKEHHKIESPVPRTAWLRASPDGQYLAHSMALAGTRIIETASGKELTILEEHLNKTATAAGFSSDNKVFVTGGAEGDLRLWSMSTLRNYKTITQAHDRYAETITFVDEGEAFISTAADQKIRCWETQAGMLIRTMKDPPDNNTCNLITLSSDGQLLYTAYSDNQGCGIRTREIATGQVWQQFQIGQRRIIRGAIASPDGGKFAVFCIDGLPIQCSVEIRNIQDGNLLVKLTGCSEKAWGRELAFSPDGSWIVSANAQGEILFWDVKNIKTMSSSASPDRKITKQHWEDLASRNVDIARTAFHELWADPKDAVELIDREYRPVSDVDLAAINTAVDNLDSNRFQVRQAATKKLIGFGNLVRLALRRCLRGEPSLQVRTLAEKILEAIADKPADPEQIRRLRTLRLLEAIRTDDAKRLLKRISLGSEHDECSRFAKSALKRLQNGSE